MMQKARFRFLGVLFCLLVFSAPSMAAEHFITDVTPVSFCAVWHAGAAADGAVQLFSDEGGTQPLATAVMDRQPQRDPGVPVGESARAAGILKVRVRGLLPDTRYFYRIVTTYTDSGQVVSSPPDPPLLSIRTEGAAARPQEGGGPFANDLIALGIYLKDSLIPVDTAIAVVNVNGAAYPVSAFSGDGIAAPWALLDLNNIYGVQDGRPLPLAGGDLVTVHHLTPLGVYRAETFRLFDPGSTADVGGNLPIYGDFAGAYGVCLEDAVAGISLFAGIPVAIKSIAGIDPPPRREFKEAVYVLQRLADLREN